jgi:predicted nucleic acid-binding protein
MYLLDTNIISELRKPKPHGGVLAWFKKISASSIFISAVTIGEIQAGIEITREQDSLKAMELENWLNQIIASNRVIPLDSECFKIWGKLMHRQSDTVSEDAMIAATAITFKLAVVTRNIKDFKRFKVKLINPFES